MIKLLNELKERRIWRVLVAYQSVTFVLLQATEFFINNYGLDGRYLTATLVAAVALLPVGQIVLVDYMAWPVSPKLASNRTYKGLRRDLNFPPTKWLVN